MRWPRELRRMVESCDNSFLLGTGLLVGVTCFLITGAGLGFGFGNWLLTSSNVVALAAVVAHVVKIGAGVFSGLYIRLVKCLAMEGTLVAYLAGGFVWTCGSVGADGRVGAGASVVLGIENK